MKNYTLILLLLIGSVGISCSFHNEIHQKKEVLERTAFLDSINKSDIQLVDIRTPEQYAEEGNFAHAKNIDFESADFYKLIEESFDKSKPLYVYCKGEIYSHEATHNLLDLGYQEVYQLKGGFDDWSEEMKAEKGAEMKKAMESK